MKKIIFALVAFGVIVSQSIAYDVCAGDFLDKYEKKLETYKEERKQNNFYWNYYGVDCKKIKKEFEKTDKSKGYDKAKSYMMFLLNNGGNSIDFAASSGGAKTYEYYAELHNDAYFDYATVRDNCGGVSKQMKARWALYKQNLELFFMSIVYRFVIDCEFMKTNQE